MCMYKKGQVDSKGLTIFNNQISFLSNGSGNFQLHYQIVPVSVPWIEFLTLWRSCWVCALYLQQIAVWSERVNCNGTLIRFNFSIEVTSPVCVGPDLLHGKRVLGVWVYMYKKSHVDSKGLTVFHNQISFLSRGSGKY